MFIKANSNGKKMKRAVAKLLRVRGVQHFSFSIQFEGKALSDDSTSLAELGLLNGSTVQVDLNILRGGGGSGFSPELFEMLNKTPSGKYGKFSITREGMSNIVPALLEIAQKESAFTGRRSHLPRPRSAVSGEIVGK